mmetsp:Transcript_7158/g.10261  ORF Transcript_7158/g.10261 Transcript_7158/m.10261 type:complete len:198 (-) Transcript_7158:184-777(-)
MEQIEIICFGGAESIHRTSQQPFARCINYYSINDPLLLVVPSAARALRTGFLGSAQISDNAIGSGEPEFVFLSPRSGDPIIDHGLLGPTYIDALEWEGRRYCKLYLPLWHPLASKLTGVGRQMDANLRSALKVIFFQIFLPFILFVERVNMRIKELVIAPIILFLKYVWDVILGVVRILKREPKYELVPIENKDFND